MAFKLRATALASAILAAPWGPAFAGAWNPPAGKGVVIVTGSFSGADVFLDGQGRRWRAPAYQKFETQFHIEAGITDWLAVIARPRFSRVETRGWRPNTVAGLGSGELGIQAQVWSVGSWVFSAQLLGRTPSAPRSAHEDRGGGEIRLMAGRSFALFGMPAFAEWHLAARLRAGRPAEAMMDVTLGARPWPRLLVMFQSFLTQTLESRARAMARGAPLGSAHTKLQLSLVYDVTPEWSLGVAGFGVVAARDAAREAGAALSVWRRF